ncbi:MAG: DUF790 family protein [Bryobacterales bacterium]
MLTADLVRARVKGADIAPSLVDPGDAEVRDLAERVFTGLRDGAAAGARLGEAVADIEEQVADLASAKLARGLLRIGQDRCETAVGAEIEPAELRLAAFLAAAARGPLGLEPDDPLGRPTAAAILAEVGAPHGLDADQAAEALYADLPAERRLSGFDVPDAEWLVHRYNLALVQALLLSATGITLTFDEPEMPRMRQLVRWIKFHQLLHSAQREGDRLRITLDGPVSLFGPSTRYGLQLARFLPALVLQPGPWRLDATILWTRARHRKQLSLTHDSGLRSHYRDHGAYRTRTQEQFAAQFAEKGKGFELVEGEAPLAVGDRDLVFPDFTLRRGEREVHLEILGYWRAEGLRERLEVLDRRGPHNLLLAASRRLRGDKAGEDPPEHPRLLSFAEVLPLAKILAAAEAVLAGAPS